MSNAFIDGILATYLVVKVWKVDIAGCEDKGVESETDKDIVNRWRVALGTHTTALDQFRPL